MSDEESASCSCSALHPSFFIVHPGLLLLCWLWMAAGCRPTPPAVTPSPPAPASRSLASRSKTPVPSPQSRVPSPQSRVPNPASLIPDPQSPIPSAWPLFRGDAQATGVVHGELPEKPDLLWTFSTQSGGFESTAAIVDGSVYIGCTDGKLYALNLQSGAKRWEFATPLGFVASAAVRDGRVYIGDSDGLFYCLEAATGKKLWSFQTDAEIDSSANFHGDHVLFGSQDSYLYCLQAASGKLVWKFQSQDQIRCFPTVVEQSRLRGRLRRPTARD